MSTITAKVQLYVSVSMTSFGIEIIPSPNFLATIYDSQGKTTFYNGKNIKHKRAKLKATRKQLQIATNTICSGHEPCSRGEFNRPDAFLLLVSYKNYHNSCIYLLNIYRKDF